MRGIIAGFVALVIAGSACSGDDEQTADASVSVDASTADGSTADGAVVDGAPADGADATALDAASGPFTLTFQGGSTYAGAHRDQDFEAAVVDPAGPTVVDSTTGTVPMPGAVWSIVFPDVLEAGTSYELHLWIDSNLVDGTAGVCDEPNDDHQWSWPTGVVAGDVVLEEDHAPGNVTDVCATFD